METKSFAKKVFTELIEEVAIPRTIDQPELVEGIVKSFNEFCTLLTEANENFNKVYQIPENKQLVFSEEIESKEIPKLNNNLYDEKVQLYINNYLPDIRVVTYTANEQPAVISSRTIDSGGIKNIKWKYAGSFADPEYTGYSIIRYSRDVEANVKFKVWGKFFQDIRERAKLLKDIIDTNIWYFKLKGLREIVWTGSYEDIMYREDGLHKFKTQDYLIRFSEIREIREKNLEQIVVQYGLEKLGN